MARSVISRGLALALVSVVALAPSCAREAPLVPRPGGAPPEVRAIAVGTGTYAYVVMGARPILVDTGWGRSTKKLERGLARLGVEPRALALIVLTHGHGDHAGGAGRLRTLSGARVLAGRGDLAMLEAGHNAPLRPMGFLARVLRPFIDRPFPPFTPDVLVDAPFDLRPSGVDGTVIPLAGHTPGSLAVVLASGDAVVGDLLRGGTVFSRSPTRHYFHEDCAATGAHIRALADAGTKRFFVGHGGPVDAARARDKLAAKRCP